MWAAQWDNIVIGIVLVLAVAYLAIQFVFAISIPRLLEALRLRARRTVLVRFLARHGSRAERRRPARVRSRHQRRGSPARHLDSQ